MIGKLEGSPSIFIIKPNPMPVRDNRRRGKKARTDAMLQQASRTVLENLERRTLLSTVDVTGGVLSYTASLGVTNEVVLTKSGTNYAFLDNSETINLSANAVAAGWVSINPNLVAGPDSGLTAITIDTMDQNDIVVVQQEDTPTTISPTGGGADTVLLTDSSNAQNITGNVTIDNSSGTTILEVDDSADPNPTTATITATTLTGLTPATIDYSGANLTAMLLKGGTGGNTFNVNGTPSAVSLDSGTGNDIVNVTATNTGDGVSIDGTGGTDTVNIGNAGSVQGILGGVNVANTGGTTALTIDDSADTTLDSSVVLTDTGIIDLAPVAISYSQLSSLTVNGGTNNNTYIVTGTPSSTTLNTGAGTDVVAIVATDSGNALALNLDGGTGDTVAISNNGNVQGILATVTITNTGGSTVLLVDDSSDTGNYLVSLTATDLSGLSPAPIDFTNANLTTLLIKGSGAGGSAIFVNGTPAPVTDIIDSGGGNIVFPEATSLGDTLTIQSLAGLDDVIVGNGGFVSGIQGAIVVASGGGSTNLVVDDDQDLTGTNATVSDSTITGLAPATITYSGLSSLAIYGGQGGNSFSVSGTPASTFLSSGAGDDLVLISGTDAGNALTVDGGAGSDIVLISNAGSVQGILGAVTIENSAGATDLIVDDSADTNPTAPTIAANEITGLAPATITFADLSGLTVALGTGGNGVIITGTSTNTTVFTGIGNDLVNVQGTGTGDPLTVNGQAGADTVVIGNASNVQGVLGDVTILNPGGTTVLLVDDSADPNPTTATISATDISGLAPGDINYAGANLTTFVIEGGTGGNTFTVTGTPIATTLVTGTGDDTTNVQATDAAAPLVISGDGGADTVNIGNAGNAQQILADVTVINSGTTLLFVDDSADLTGQTATLSTTSLTGLTPGDINYGGANIVGLTVNGGSGGNTFTVTGTPSTTTLNSGAGNDTVNVLGTNAGDSLGIDGDAGSDVVNITDAGSVQGILGAVSVANSLGLTALVIDDSADPTARTATLSDSSLTGLAPAVISYVASELSGLTVSGGTGGNTFTVTGSAAITVLNTGTGNDHVSVQGTDAGTALVVNGQAGSDVVDVSNAGSVQGILGNVGITNAGGSTALTIDDSADPIGQNPILSAAGGLSTLSGLAPADISFVTANISTLAIDTGTGNDTETIDFSTGNPIPAGGFFYNGGGGNNTLDLQGGSFTNEIYNPSGPGAGSISLDSTFIGFANLQPINDSVNVINFTFNSLPNESTVNFNTGPVFNGFQTTTIASAEVPPEFELINVANKVNITTNINTAGGDAQVNLDAGLTGSGLTAFNVNTGSGNDIFNVLATEPGVALSIKSNGGNDTFNVTGLSGSGSVTFDGGTGTDSLNVDANDTGPVTITPTTISNGVVTINDSNFEKINVYNILDLPITTSSTVTLTGTEGDALSNVLLGKFTDSDPNSTANNFVASINWGDSTSSAGTIVAMGGGVFDVYGTHVYAQAGTIPVSVLVTDEGTSHTTHLGTLVVTTSDRGGATTTINSTANIARSTISAHGVSVNQTEALFSNVPVATFKDVSGSEPASNYNAVINWGDGSPTSVGTVTFGADGQFHITGGHRYGHTGNFTVTVKIYDTGVLMGTTSSSAYIVEAPLTGTGVTFNAVHNTTFSGVVGHFADGDALNRNASEYTIKINWGDGTTTNGTAVWDNTLNEWDILGTHKYSKKANFAVTIEVTDGSANVKINSTAKVS